MEGIAVEFGTPGFLARTILAAANAYGPTAPRTNVARTAIEDTTERTALLRKIYSTLFTHIANETQRLRTEEGYSLTWAVQQTPFLIAPLVSRVRQVASRTDLYMEALADVPLYLLETSNGRRSGSLNDLRKIGSFWTVESQLVSSVEMLIREAETELTARDLILNAQKSGIPLPEGPVVANLDNLSMLNEVVRSEFEVTDITGYIPNRRLDLNWVRRGTRRKWLSNSELLLSALDTGIKEVVYFARHQERRTAGRRQDEFYVPLEEINLTGLEEFLAVSAARTIYLLPGSPVANFLKEVADRNDPHNLVRLQTYFDAVHTYLVPSKLSGSEAEGAMARVLKQFEAEGLFATTVSHEDFLASVASTKKTGLFNPLSWTQRNPEQDDPLAYY